MQYITKKGLSQAFLILRRSDSYELAAGELAFLLLFVRHNLGLVELVKVLLNEITSFHDLAPHLVFILVPVLPKVKP
jgi:hypothetical protein